MTRHKVFLAAIAIAVVLCVALGFHNEARVSHVSNAKVIDLQQQSLIKSTGDKKMYTEIRYLVITENETFICESSILNGKWNNSDIFFHLKKDSVYNFKVSGMGKSFFYDYRNILEATPVQTVLNCDGIKVINNQ